jgi:hypothetical protein
MNFIHLITGQKNALTNLNAGELTVLSFIKISKKEKFKKRLKEIFLD